MHHKPLITIITVTYNSEKYLKDAINSVLAQDYPNIEYIIGDDCSTDTTWEIIKEYKDPRIKAYRNETNLREYPNRNKAINQATGEYLIFIDGDDIMYPYALEVFSYYIEHFPDCSMIFTRDWDSRICYPFQANPLTLYRFEYLDGGIIGGNFTKVLFKRKAIIEAGYLPNDIRSGDTYIQLKIALHHQGLVISDGLTWWRRRAGNATEHLFKDNRYLVETINYRIALLDDVSCPLDKEEKEIAKNNIYGIYLRTLLRMVRSFRFAEIAYLWRRIKIPIAYYKALFIGSKHNYYNQYSGDNPLHTPFSN